MRATLCVEAVRLGRRLAKLLPEEAEVYGLLALMELQASRAAGASRTKTEKPFSCRNRPFLWD